MVKQMTNPNYIWIDPIGEIIEERTFESWDSIMERFKRERIASGECAYCKGPLTPSSRWEACATCDTRIDEGLKRRRMEQERLEEDEQRLMRIYGYEALDRMRSLSRARRWRRPHQPLPHLEGTPSAGDYLDLENHILGLTP